MNAPTRLVRAVDWCLRDRRTGRITIGQWPNLPLWLFLVLTLALALADRLPHPAEMAATSLRAGASLALAWWALDEIIRGVNPWRRALGTAVLLVQIAASARG